MLAEQLGRFLGGVLLVCRGQIVSILAESIAEGFSLLEGKAVDGARRDALRERLLSRLPRKDNDSSPNRGTSATP